LSFRNPRSSWSRKCLVLVLGLTSVAASACRTVNFSAFPPPAKCPTLEDTGWLAEVVPVETEPIAVLETEARLDAFVYAGAYCREAKKRLSR
jgi:hypothetical protein